MPEMCEEDRMELVIARTVLPGLSSVNAKLEVFTAVMNQVMTQSGEDRKENQKNHEELERQLKHIETILNGNGKEGLVATVSKLTDWVSDQKKLQWVVIGAVVANVVGLISLALFK